MTGRPSVGLRQNGQAQVNKIKFIICVYVCIWCCHQVSLQHVYYYWGVFFWRGGLSGIIQNTLPHLNISRLLDICHV